MEYDHKVQGEPDSDRSGTVYTRSLSSSPLHEKHQQILSQHLSIGIVETSLEGRYRDVSEEFCRMLGYEKDELLQRGMKDVTPEADYQLDIQLHGQLVAGEIPYYKIEKRFARKDGQIIWVHLTRSAIRDDRGKILYLVGIVLDITERHVTQEALRESERKFSLIFDKLPFAATLARAQDGVILDVNEAFETLFEYSKDQAIGKTLLELELIPNVENRKRILAELFERGSVRGAELVLTTRSRGTRIFLVNMDLVETRGESYILQTDQDITEIGSG